MSFKNLKQIDIFRPKTPDEDYEDYEDFKASVENSQKVFLASMRKELPVISNYCKLTFRFLFQY